MVFNSRPQGRRSIRLRGYDYPQPGAYFLTICSHERRSIFSRIENGRTFETPIGQLVRTCWLGLPQHFPSVEIEAFVIMPNHLHGILNLARTLRYSPGLRKEALSLPRFGSIPTIVRTFKAAVTREVRKSGSGLLVWQRGYYERIIRDGKEPTEIDRYIRDNPLQWEWDENHPAFVAD